MPDKRNKVNLLDVEIDNIRKVDVINEIHKVIAEGQDPIAIYPVNTDTLIKAYYNSGFLSLLNSGDLVIADGKPLLWYAKYLGGKLVELISGAGLFVSLCKEAVKEKHRIFLLGAAEGVGEQAKAKLEQRYPGIIITGTYSPKPGFLNNPKEMDHIIQLLTNSDSTILAVGLGNPLQEEFISAYKDQYNIPVSISLGGSIDYAAGVKLMPPDWLGEIGLAWFYRLICEPKRLWKRYLIDDMQILGLLHKQKLRRNT